MSSWTEERVERLKELWADGLSASQIAMKLDGDFSRNAIIGKTVRLNLPRRATTQRTRTQNLNAGLFRRPSAIPSIFATKPSEHQKPALPRKGSRRTLAAISHLPIKFEPGPAGGVTFADLDEARQCKFELSNAYERPENFRFCGAQRTFGSPYCEHHSAIAYNHWPRKEAA